MVNNLIMELSVKINSRMKNTWVNYSALIVMMILIVIYQLYKIKSNNIDLKDLILVALNLIPQFLDLKNIPQLINLQQILI